jgi:hypothetical protein
MAAAITLRPLWCPPPASHIQQEANMLHNKSMSLKLKNIIVFIMYLLAIEGHNALSTCRA